MATAIMTGTFITLGGRRHAYMPPTRHYKNSPAGSPIQR